MKILDYDKARLIELNRLEYGEDYKQIKFIDPDQIDSYTTKRETLLAEILQTAESAYSNTKLDTRNLPPGCEICGAGSWSCLFVNGICNCNCFYCPAIQNQVDIPTTSSVQFERPEDYIQYLKKFDFRGISLSGGEPLMTFDKTLSFLQAIREAFGREKYIWLYTNGALLDEEKLKALEACSLDEIRFDLGARDYKLDKIRLAIGHIRNVTVEIPAVPEELERLKALCKELEEMGVNYLNLHQMRLTPHNFKNLITRKYTFLHGNKVTVLESELTALRLMLYCIKEGIDLPVNYCSFVYKNRYQNAAARRRLAPGIMEAEESMTESGFIRQVRCTGPAASITRLSDHLTLHGGSENAFKRTSEASLLLHADCLGNTGMIQLISELRNIKLEIAYFHVKLLSALSYRNPFREIRLSDQRKVVVEKIPAADAVVLSCDELPDFNQIFLDRQKDFSPFENIPKWNQLASYEWIASGLQEYF